MEQTRIVLDNGMGYRCELLLSPEDAKRCQTDLNFAQTLLDASLATNNPSRTNVAVPSGSCSSGSSSPSCVDATNCEETTSTFKWPHAAILLLVDLFKSHESNLTAGKISQKKVWENISKSVSTNGHMVSGLQCMSKFNGMKKTYKAVRDHNGKSGNNPRTWPYLEAMDSLLGEHPFMEPPALASSTPACSRSERKNSNQERSDSEFNADDVDRPDVLPARLSRKRHALQDLNCVANAILESRRIAEANKDRREQERSVQRAAMLNKIDELLGKI